MDAAPSKTTIPADLGFQIFFENGLIYRLATVPELIDPLVIPASAAASSANSRTKKGSRSTLQRQRPYGQTPHQTPGPEGGSLSTMDKNNPRQKKEEEEAKEKNIGKRQRPGGRQHRSGYVCNYHYYYHRRFPALSKAVTFLFFSPPFL